jgi:hypothetical protein
MLVVTRAYKVLAKHSDPKKIVPVVKRLTEQVRQAVELGERHIRQQRKLIAALERDKHDTAAAKRLLATFEKLQSLHKVHYDRLRHDAAEAKHQARGRG